jgi:hypothetical protein
MDRLHLGNPFVVWRDEDSEDKMIIAQTGDKHERGVLERLKPAASGLIEIPKSDSAAAKIQTLPAIASKAPIIFQAALGDGSSEDKIFWTLTMKALSTVKRENGSHWPDALGESQCFVLAVIASVATS